VVRGRAIEIVSRVKVAYYDVLLADEAVRLSENTVRRRSQDARGDTAHERGGARFELRRSAPAGGAVEPGAGSASRREHAAASARRQLAVELNLERLDSVRVAGTLADLEIWVK
jgi:hypothetical protein